MQSITPTWQWLSIFSVVGAAWIAALGRRQRLLQRVIAAVAVLTAFNPIALGETVSWDAPDLDTWTYPAAGDPGTRLLGPTFTTDPGLNPETQQFYYSGASSPSRRGMSIVAFDTSTKVEAGLALSRYQVDSITVTFTMQASTGGTVYYDDTPDSNADFLDAYINGSIDTARPMELYGAQFQDEYEGWGFAGSGGSGPPTFEEYDYPYHSSGGSTVLSVYPVASDGEGQLLDVSNSLTGGYSATAEDNFTEPFDPAPWSIGKNDGLSPGDAIQPGTTLTFDLDLSLPGVTEYVQQSLHDGGLGFVLSSLHFPGDVHGSGDAFGYPQWYLKEWPTSAGGAPPTLMLEYSILSDRFGDYNHDGVVNIADYSVWRNSLGASGEELAADGNRDGTVNAADYQMWREYFGTVYGTDTIATASVPEPSGASVVGMLGLVAVFNAWVVWFARSEKA